MFKNIIRKYENVKNECLNTEVVDFNKALNIIVSILLALFFISAPLILLINLLILVDYLKFVIIGIAILIYFFYFLCNLFYIQSKYGKYRIKGLYIIPIVETSYVLLACILGTIISFIWW